MPSGHTVWLRTHNEDGTLKSDSGQAAVAGKSGHTVWLRTHNPDGTLKGAVAQASSPIVTSSGGTIGTDGSVFSTATPATGAKSGKTLAARAAYNFQLNIEHYLILFGIGVASFWVIKHVVLGKKASKKHRGDGSNSKA